MSVEPGIVDANILIYALDADASQHVACRTLLEAAQGEAPVSEWVDFWDCLAAICAPCEGQEGKEHLPNQCGLRFVKLYRQLGV